MQHYAISMDGQVLSVTNPNNGLATPILFENKDIPDKVVKAMNNILSGVEIKTILLHLPDKSEDECKNYEYDGEGEQ